MKISFEGIGEKAATFIGDGVKAGDAVKVTAAGTVSPCGAGEAFDGFVTGLCGEYAGVVISGAVTARCSGAAPGFGRVELCADGKGGVAAAGAAAAAAAVSPASEGGEGGEGDTAAAGSAAAGGPGTLCLVVDYDEAAETVTFIM